MKISKLLMFGIVGAALVVIAKRLMNVKENNFQEDHLNFDSDFIPGSKKLNIDLPDHVHPSWFRAPQRYSEDTDAMFI